MSALIPVSEKKQPLVPPFVKFIIGGISGSVCGAEMEHKVSYNIVSDLPSFCTLTIGDVCRSELRTYRKGSLNGCLFPCVWLVDVPDALAQSATHPLDVTKVRMQISGSPLVQTFTDTWKEAGLRGFYAGWSAGFLRQLTYSTTRLGIYATLFDVLDSKYGRLNYPTMVTLGLVSGMAGAFVGTPTELMLVRMTADLKLPPEKRWNYKDPFSGMYSIYKKEGLFALWKGAIPTMVRAGIANGAQLGTYTRTKMFLVDKGLFTESVSLQFIAGMISSFVMCITSVPVDGAKSRIQNWNLKEPPPGIVKMIFFIGKTEGITALWRGFIPYYIRSGPHAIITMIGVDQLQRLYLEHFIKQD